MMEAGVPDYEVITFNGIVAPAATPAAIVSKGCTSLNSVGAEIGKPIAPQTASVGVSTRDLACLPRSHLITSSTTVHRLLRATCLIAHPCERAAVLGELAREWSAARLTLLGRL